MKVNSKPYSADNNIISKDISIFVFTYKRPELLNRTLKSLVEQTSLGFEIIVFDNSKEKEGENPANSIQAKYIKTYGSTNWDMAKQFMNRKYTIILHDDDLLHSQYIEVCLQALNKFEGLALISPCQTNCPVSYYPDFSKKNLRKTGVFCTNKAEYAALSRIYCYIWSGSLVKSSIYKNALLNPLYGKIADLPMLFELLSEDNFALILTDRNSVYYGIHEGQDSNTKENNLSRKQFEAYLEYMCKIMRAGNNLFARSLFLLSLPKMFYVINKNFVKEPIEISDIDFLLHKFNWNILEKIYIKRYKNILCVIIGVFIRVWALLYIRFYLYKLKVNF